MLGVVARSSGIPWAMAVERPWRAPGAGMDMGTTARRSAGAAPGPDGLVTFGARLHAAVRERGPLCAGIDPHAALLHEWGLDDDGRRAGAVRADRRRGAGAGRRGGQAAVGVLRAVRQPRASPCSSG